ncbi:MAG: hypothetical protein ACPGYK_06880 [Flavobacteriales bacterium]
MRSDLESQLPEMIAEMGMPNGLDVQTYISQIIQQLVKDFQLDVDRIACASIGFVELLADEIAEGLSGERADAIFASFYRLDLGEELIQKTLHDLDRREAAQALAMHSVKRAAMKVWSRWKYKSEGI